MIKNKKNFALNLIFVIGLFFLSNAQSANQFFQSYTPFEFFDELTGGIDESFNEYLATRACSIGPDEVLNWLTDPTIAIQNVIQKNLYGRTNPTITRSILELPYFQRTWMPHADSTYCNPMSTLSCSLFLNQTKEKYYYKDFDAIRDYLSAFNDDFIEVFEELGKKIHEIYPDAASISIDTILSLFTNIKLEERRAGTLFAWNYQSPRYKFQIQLPLYYIEHNFMLTEKEQDAIANEPFIKNLTKDQPPQDPNAINKAIREHIAEDLLGLGDLKLLALITGCCGNLELAVGPEIIFPSACVITDKLIGGRFETCPYQPTVDFMMFACGIQDGFGQKEANFAKDLGIGIIERLTRIAGNTNLGQGYLSAFARAEAEYHMTSTLSHQHIIRLGGGTSYYTTRFFNEIKDAASFNRDYGIAADVQKNLRFLQDELVSTVYPLPRTVRITPGPRFEYRGSIKKGHWAGFLECGYDFWFQGADQVSIKLPHSTHFPLDIISAKPSNAFENKLFASLTWSGARNKHLWSIALFGDYTFSSSGTGNDWSAGFSAHIHW